MGKKIISLKAENYNDGVAHLRYFSEKTHKAFIEDAFASIDSANKPYRRIIGGGDEITLICKAEDALDILKAYFQSLKVSEQVIPENCEGAFKQDFNGDEGLAEKHLDNTACAGIAVMHAKSPFTVAYEIAEAACENAKKEAHKEPDNYFDFHYIHAGITTDFDTIREREQKMTGRPYNFSEAAAKFDKMKPLLNIAGRANVKALGEAAQKGKPDFLYEIKRVNAYVAGELNKPKYGNYTGEKEFKEADIKLVYDMSEFYDLWFAKE